jgi:hypothetical protein
MARRLRSSFLCSPSSLGVVALLFALAGTACATRTVKRVGILRQGSATRSRRGERAGRPGPGRARADRPGSASASAGALDRCRQRLRSPLHADGYPRTQRSAPSLRLCHRPAGRAGEPVVIENAPSRHWEAVTTPWTFAYLARRGPKAPGKLLHACTPLLRRGSAHLRRARAVLAAKSGRSPRFAWGCCAVEPRSMPDLVNDIALAVSLLSRGLSSPHPALSRGRRRWLRRFRTRAAPPLAGQVSRR